MSRRTLGLGMILAGGGLVLAGVIVAATGDSSDGEIPAAATVATSQVSASSSTATATTSTTRVASTTSMASTTTTSTSSAPPSTSTTSTTLMPETVDEFIEAFAAALADGDLDFVLARLHPEVILGYSPETCEAWVTTEIMGLSSYKLTGVPTGPTDKSVLIAGDLAIIRDFYTAPVSFSFSGQSFDASADFAVVDELVHWLGSCG